MLNLFFIDRADCETQTNPPTRINSTNMGGLASSIVQVNRFCWEIKLYSIGYHGFVIFEALFVKKAFVKIPLK
jgi:hypothetical protein